MKKSVIVLSCLLQFALATVAQTETLEKEIVIEKNYKPIEQAAFKLAIVPSYVKFEPAASQLTFSMQSIPVATGNGICTLPAYRYPTTLNNSDSRGYVNFGIGSYLDINAMAGYKLISKQDTKLNVYWQHLSTSGTMTTDRYRQFHQEWLDECVGLQFEKEITKGCFKSKIDYNYSHTLWNKGVDSNSDKRKYWSNLNDVDFSVRYFSKLSPLKFDIGINLNYLNYSNPFVYRFDSDDASQLNMKLSGRLAKSLRGGSQAGIRYAIEYQSTQIAQETLILLAETYRSRAGNADNREKQNVGLLRLSPFFEKEAERLCYSIGANVDFRLNEKPVLRVSPQVSVSYAVFSGLEFFGIATGGSSPVRFDNLLSQNRYAAPNEFLNMQHTYIDTRLGFKIGPFSGFSTSFYGGYAKVKNALVYSLAQTDMCGNRYAQIPLSGFTWGANVRYEYSGLVGFEAGVCNAKQDADGSGFDFGADRPTWIFNTSVAVTPIDRLRITLGYELRANRALRYRQYIDNSESQTGEVAVDKILPLGRVSDLYFMGSYSINSHLGVNVKASNLLNKRWNLATGFRNQGLAVMAGVSYNFQ